MDNPFLIHISLVLQYCGITISELQELLGEGIEAKATIVDHELYLHVDMLQDHHIEALLNSDLYKKHPRKIRDLIIGHQAVELFVNSFSDVTTRQVYEALLELYGPIIPPFILINAWLRDKYTVNGNKTANIFKKNLTLQPLKHPSKE